jgi:spore coat protein U-like protein
MKRLIIAALAASTVIVGTPAMAETVHFSGKRAVECSITGADTTIRFGDLSNLGDATPQSTGNVTVFCNQPFKATVTSENGYLKLQTSNTANNSNSETDFTSHANPQFAAGLNYGLVVPGAGTFGSQYLSAGVAVTTPQIPAVNVTGSATYDTIAGSKPLLGGTYSDTVTLTLTPQGV